MLVGQGIVEGAVHDVPAGQTHPSRLTTIGSRTIGAIRMPNVDFNFNPLFAVDSRYGRSASAGCDYAARLMPGPLA
jgi:hypothetical protein